MTLGHFRSPGFIAPLALAFAAGLPACTDPNLTPVHGPYSSEARAGAPRAADGTSPTGATAKAESAPARVADVASPATDKASDVRDLRGGAERFREPPMRQPR
jgi:hypothetical protein